MQSGTVIADKYRLDRLLATGGMGTVWTARHLALDTLIAVKFIGAAIDDRDDARSRFEREAKVAAVLRSPHVVQIHDYGVDRGVPYLAMELLHGEDFAARLARSGKLPVDEVVRVVCGVARVLRCAAEAGVVHRDLKPGNVFLARTGDGDEIVKVLDFGVAKLTRLAIAHTTGSGVMIGSPRYMSPEQARDSRYVDHRSDLWSLAVIAYRALTGELPFTGGDVADVLRKVMTEPVVPPSLRVPGLGPEMDAFFARGLARDPEQRFQTAQEMAAAFAAAAELPPPSFSGPYSRREILGSLADVTCRPPALTLDAPRDRTPPRSTADDRTLAVRSVAVEPRRAPGAPERRLAPLIVVTALISALAGWTASHVLAGERPRPVAGAPPPSISGSLPPRPAPLGAQLCGDEAP